MPSTGMTITSYSFWLKGKFWAQDGSEHTDPFHAAQPNPLGPFAIGPAPKSADVGLGRLELNTGQRIAYLFDFGDEWRVPLKVVDRWEAADDVYPMLVEAEGVPPPQYPELDEND